MNLMKKTALGIFSCVAVSSIAFATADETPLNGFTDFNSRQYYIANAGKVTNQDWLEYIKSNYTLTDSQKSEMAGLHYYLRLNPNADLSKITETKSDNNPDNVNMVIKLMPKSDFTAMFPKAKDGSPCSYLNLLKAVALMPGLFSDFKDFGTVTGLQPTEDMSKPDLVWRRFLAATMAHAIQETSNSGKDGLDYKAQLINKIPGTFGSLTEAINLSYSRIGAESAPIWSKTGQWRQAAMKNPNGEYDLYESKGLNPNSYNCNLYGGRGVHQITYQYNYANISLFLYGDLRLIKYPELVASNSILPWLTTLTYSVIPKSGYPSIVEVFDGQWKRHLDNSSATESIKKRYSQQFPMTVLQINGIECGPDADPQIADNTKLRCQAYYDFDTNTELEFKKDGSVYKAKLFSSDIGNDPVTPLNGEQGKIACSEISQPGIVNPPLVWRRYMFLNNSGGLIDSETVYYIFAGKGIKALQSGPKEAFAYHDYYMPAEEVLSFQEVKEAVENDPGKSNKPDQKVSLTPEDNVPAFTQGTAYNTNDFVTYNNQLWYVAWPVSSGTPEATDPAWNSPWRVQGTIVKK